MTSLEKRLLDVGNLKTYDAKPIYYKRKLYDAGIIIDQRKYHFTLKGKVNPCYSFRPMGLWSKYLTELSPQKNNFFVYIPWDNLIPRSWIVHVTSMNRRKCYTLAYVLKKSVQEVQIINVPGFMYDLKAVYAYMRELKGVTAEQPDQVAVNF